MNDYCLFKLYLCYEVEGGVSLEQAKSSKKTKGQRNDLDFASSSENSRFLLIVL